MPPPGVEVATNPAGMENGFTIGTNGFGACALFCSSVNSPVAEAYDAPPGEYIPPPPPPAGVEVPPPDAPPLTPPPENTPAPLVGAGERFMAAAIGLTNGC